MRAPGWWRWRRWRRRGCSPTCGACRSRRGIRSDAMDLPFVEDGLLYAAITILGGGLGGLLALKQSAWEEMKGTFRYLLVSAGRAAAGDADEDGRRPCCVVMA